MSSQTGQQMFKASLLAFDPERTPPSLGAQCCLPAPQFSTVQHPFSAQPEGSTSSASHAH